MTPNDVIEFAMSNPASWMATSIDNQPHVRGMLLWFVDETGFYYHTASCKQLAKQISENPKMEIAFISSGPHQGESRMLRVEGTVEIVEDAALTNRLTQERPWVQGLQANMPEGTELVIFRLVNAQAHFWDMTTNGNESNQPRIAIA